MVAIKGQTKFRYFVSKERSKVVSKSPIPGVDEGKGDGDLRCRSLLTVCQSCLGLPRDEETTLE